MQDTRATAAHGSHGDDRLLSGRALAWVASALGVFALFMALWVPRLLSGGFLMAPLMILPTAILGIVAGVFGVRTGTSRRQRTASALGLALSAAALAVTAVATVVF